MMEVDFYGWLKDVCEKNSFHTVADCAFVHGQIVFAYIAELITKEQEVELIGMIPEYSRSIRT